MSESLKEERVAAARAAWPDPRLVSECVSGNQEAWEALIDRYKNLIYSIPIKLGLSADDSGEIFQTVCTSLLSELPKLRDSRALPAWLIRVTSNQCWHWKRKQSQFLEMDDREERSPAGQDTPKPLDDLLHELELEQILRDALLALSPQCRQLVTMLFFETPPRPYEEIAKSLGLARGSIGFTRSRCLEQLRKRLAKAGFTRK